MSGMAGTGAFNQYNGTVNLAGGILQMGIESPGVGTYNLHDGQLQVGTIFLAANRGGNPWRRLSLTCPGGP